MLGVQLYIQLSCLLRSSTYFLVFSCMAMQSFIGLAVHRQRLRKGRLIFRPPENPRRLEACREGVQQASGLCRTPAGLKIYLSKDSAGSDDQASLVASLVEGTLHPIDISNYFFVLSTVFIESCSNSENSGGSVYFQF